jgi:hypothetical protein
MIGAIPGLGGSVVDWIAYGHAVQTSKKNPHFGKGDIRGVVAPESANNAMQGGALLPTMLFGIPGSGSMAVFLGGMVLIGIQPGPSMVGADINVTSSIIWSLALANIMGAGICILLARPISRLTTIPFPLLAPPMIALICFAAFQATRDLSDLVALLAIGLLGILMKRFGWPRPALLIGYVLAPQAETFFYQALQFNGWAFLIRPGVLIIAALTLASIYFGLKNRVDDTGPTSETAVTSHASRNIQIAFAVAMMVFFGVALWDSAGHSLLGAVFPLGVGVVGAVFGVILLLHLWGGHQDHPAFFDYEIVGDHVGNEGAGWFWSGPAWIGGLVAATALVGFYIAMIGFFLAFLRLRAGATWTKTLVMTAAAAAFILGLAYMLSLDFPAGLLQSAIDLPWPIR